MSDVCAKCDSYLNNEYYNVIIKIPVNRWNVPPILHSCYNFTGVLTNTSTVCIQLICNFKNYPKI